MVKGGFIVKARKFIKEHKLKGPSGFLKFVILNYVEAINMVSDEFILKGNIRDYADVSQLVCLSNLESLNALFINDGMNQSERLIKLNKVAIQQMKLLTEDTRLKKLEHKTKL
jgi:hypothetical protein